MGDATDDLLAEEERLAFDGWDDGTENWHTPMHGDTNDLSPRRRFYASTRGAGQRRLHPLDDPQLVRAFIDQGKVWCTASLEYLPIFDTQRGDREHPRFGMEPSHALNTARYILRNAIGTCTTLSVSGGLPEAGSSFKLVIEDTSARYYLLNTALVQALLRRAGEKQPAPGLPWEGVAS